jgi:pepF/M3 family oligoendopeptidase
MTPMEKIAEALPHWDLSNVYPGLDTEQFQRDVDELNRQLDELDAFLDAHQIARGNPLPEAPALRSAVDGYLERTNAVLELSGTLGAYVRSFVTTDSYNTAARRWLSRLEQSSVRLRQQGTRFDGWLGDNDAGLPALLAQPGPAQEHAFVLLETAEQSRYLMSEAEEAMAAELSLSGSSAWGKLQGTVSSQLSVPFERDGRREMLPIAALQNISWHDPSEEVRKRAYQAELAAWETVREPLAACLNGVKGANETLNRRRGRTDALHTSLDQSRLDRKTLDAMLSAMRESFPVFRRYLRAKAARLGQPALPWWDLFAPVVSTSANGGERHFSFAEAEGFILHQFGQFSGRLAGLAERAFANRWIDAEPRAGKRGGAFCMWVPGVRESRVLCNFDGSLDQLLTVAHELGHAFHNECAAGELPLQTITPMTLAETASTFCETLVTEATLAHATSQAEELSILETFLIGATQVVVDITSRFMFEQEVFERRAQAELSADDFCEIMLRAQRATYGDGLDERYLHPYMWAWKPHYYRAELAFYNYPYAFGLLFGTGLYALYQSRGPAFVADYEALLASTGLAAPAELAARFGIDIRQPQFWRDSLAVIERRIDRYLTL